MQQDRNLELQRSRERIEQTADLTLSQLGRRIGNWDLLLRGIMSLPPCSLVLSKSPTGATFILVSHGPIALYPNTPLLFVPEAPAPGQPDGQINEVRLARSGLSAINGFASGIRACKWCELPLGKPIGQNPLPAAGVRFCTVRFARGIYSYRKAEIGSTCVARRAGI